MQAAHSLRPVAFVGPAGAGAERTALPRSGQPGKTCCVGPQAGPHRSGRGGLRPFLLSFSRGLLPGVLPTHGVLLEPVELHIHLK